MVFVCFVKQKTAYEMRISDWGSDVCSSDLCTGHRRQRRHRARHGGGAGGSRRRRRDLGRQPRQEYRRRGETEAPRQDRQRVVSGKRVSGRGVLGGRRVIKEKTPSIHATSDRPPTITTLHNKRIKTSC